MIGLNGLGRIGRLVVRQLAQKSPGLLTALNDPAPPEVLAHLLRHDSIHRPAPLNVDASSGALVLEGQRIPLFDFTDPNDIPWATTSVRLVVEASGRFTRRSDAARHLRDTVTHVVISAPSPDPDFTVIAPFNGHDLDLSRHRVLSNASCTAHATAPLLDVLERTFGLSQATMSTVHVATNDQRLLDGPHTDLRRARAALVGIHPTRSSAFQALRQALPWLPAPFEGWAYRVPTLSVNLVVLTALLKRTVEPKAIHEAFREAAEHRLAGILAVTNEPLVSSDFTGRPESVIVDLELTRVLPGGFVQVFGWHDNETAYATRLVELLQDLAARIEGDVPTL